MMNPISAPWTRRVLFFSLLLLFFSIPHTLEDFATGEPAKQGIPAPALALVVSAIFALQALGLYWLGQGQRRGIIVQLVVGLFWPIASGLAQLPIIFAETPYRFGAISIFYVAGMIVIGSLLCFSALIAFIKRNQK